MITVDSPDATAHESLVNAWANALTVSVDSGAILEADAARIIEVVRNSSVLKNWQPKG
jgi:hypothetical protein